MGRWLKENSRIYNKQVSLPRSQSVGRGKDDVSAYVAFAQSFKGSDDIPRRVPWT